MLEKTLVFARQKADFIILLFHRDRKDRPNPKDFTIADLKGETSGRLPGKIGGQQFIIRDCQVSEFLISWRFAYRNIQGYFGIAFGLYYKLLQM